MRAHCAVTSAVIRGIEAIPVTVEVSVGAGLVGMSIVGMADTAIQEARERVRGAIRACGFSVPNQKIVINLAPGSLRKSGSGLDLPIALGILAASGQIDAALLADRLFVGELSLDGAVRPIAGTLAFGICAHRLGLQLVSCGADIVPIDDLVQLRIADLGALVREEPFAVVDRMHPRDDGPALSSLDFRDVAGQETTKRAAQIAAAGGHGLLMIGPPGSGKTMIASRIASILPPLSQDEMLEAAAVHSVAGEDIEPILCGIRPFRHPHHSATIAGLVGGGSPVRPGEVSLAHCGTLFLDELPEFKPSTLQSLRQPIEAGRICLTRADGNVELPARFMLVAAANPCPCGYLGDDTRECECTIPQIRAYQGRVGGPLMDRIDIQLDVRRLPASSIFSSGTGTDSATLREGVMAARAFARRRRRRPGQEGGSTALRADMSPVEVIDSCGLGDAERTFISSMADAESLSGRALISCLKVARTIADMEQCEEVDSEHIAEALAFRIRGR